MVKISLIAPEHKLLLDSESDGELLRSGCRSFTSNSGADTGMVMERDILFERSGLGKGTEEGAETFGEVESIRVWRCPSYSYFDGALRESQYTFCLRDE